MVKNWSNINPNIGKGIVESRNGQKPIRNRSKHWSLCAMRQTIFCLVDPEMVKYRFDIDPNSGRKGIVDMFGDIVKKGIATHGQGIVVALQLVALVVFVVRGCFPSTFRSLLQGRGPHMQDRPHDFDLVHVAMVT